MSRRTPAGSNEDERFSLINDRLELLVRATENLLEAGARETLNANHHDGDITRRISHFRPSTYDGSTDPMKLENWIREMEKIFDVVGCPDLIKVNQAVFYLVGQADLWWRQNKIHLTQQVNFSWEAFVQALKDKFFPIHLQKKLTQEFANLTMGNLSVDEYYQKFVELLRFAPHVAPTAEMQAHKFELGLTLDLSRRPKRS